MELGLGGKVALVTGASQGLGHAIASRLAAEGMRVAVSARNEAKLKSLAEAVEAAGGHCLVHAADLRDPAAPAAFVESAVRSFGRIDVVVNNAGATVRGDFLALGDEQWSDGFELKFFGAMRLSRAAWPHLVASGGSIVNIAGVGGRTGSAEFTIGGSVNAALMHLTKSLADRGNTDGVRVNALNPGLIRTERLSRRINLRAERDKLSESEAAERMAAEMGIRDFGWPEDVASAVAFMVSAKAGYLQGAVIDLDGGLTRAL
jgi:3-oxoacyl-[acyl-carrier protein] reductase